MALVVLLRPEALGPEARTALARIVPRFAPRLSPARPGGATQ
jgi:hypothetical protein